jgi:lysophospholipase L1-like esterase
MRPPHLLLERKSRDMFQRLLASLLITTGLLSASTNRADETMPLRTGRTAEDRGKVAVVEQFGGKNGERRRLDFDYWNLQLVREDSAVGTIFLGDSITEFWAVDAFFRPSDGLIINRGISSDTASNMVRRFEADVLQLRPRNVVILAGDNDISLSPADMPEDKIVDAVIASFEQMIGAATAAKIRVVLCSIPPMTAGPAGHARFRRIVPRINERLQKLADTRSILLVDYAKAMSDARGDLRPELTGDGIHPNDAGYHVMAETLRSAMVSKDIKF